MTKDEAIEALQVVGNIAPEYKNSPFFYLYLRIKVDDATEIAEFINQQAEQIEKQDRQIDQMRDCRNCKNLNERNYSIKTERCYNCKPSTLSEWEWEGK